MSASLIATAALGLLPGSTQGADFEPKLAESTLGRDGAASAMDFDLGAYVARRKAADE